MFCSTSTEPVQQQCSGVTLHVACSVILRAEERERQYELSGSRSRVMVFIDEAGLPNEQKMELKVLHTPLDEGKVAFCAISNAQFDDANRNRMLVVSRYDVPACYEASTLRAAADSEQRNPAGRSQACSTS
eukprot:134017-Rhodomonas_salina.3